MTPEEKVTLARYAHQMLRGRMQRRLTEYLRLLTTAQAAHRNGATKVVTERLEVVVDGLKRDLLELDNDK